MQTRFGNVCLSLIVLLLLVIACRPLYQPYIANRPIPQHETAKAAGPVQYKVVALPNGAFHYPSECENLLNDQGKEGWHLVLIQPLGDAFAVFSK